MAEERRAKGFTSPSFSNPNQHFEIEQSSYMTHLVDEIQYLCSPGQFFPPYNIYKTLEHLSTLKYKNTELVPKIREKMLAMINGNDIETELDRNALKKVFRDKFGRDAKHYVYRGFEDSNEFYSHIETLLNWQSEDEQFIKAIEEASTIQDQAQKEDVYEILNLMKHILQAGKDIQNLQEEMAHSIEAVRSQYLEMSDAFDKNEFLQKNKYIKYDLLQLQEKLVEAGLLDPYESIGSIKLENMPLSKRMARATEVFYDLTKDYYPELAPKISHLFEFDDVKSKRQPLTLREIEKQNDFTLKYIGLVLGKLAEMRNTVRRDVVDNDFSKLKNFDKTQFL